MNPDPHPENRLTIRNAGTAKIRKNKIKGCSQQKNNTTIMRNNAPIIIRSVAIINLLCYFLKVRFIDGHLLPPPTTVLPGCGN